MTRPRRALVRRLASPPARRFLLLIALVASIGCTPPGDTPTDVDSIPHPSLEGLEAHAARELAEARRRFEAALTDARSDAGDRARAFGELGTRYRAYGFSGAARACYTQAARLEPGEFRWPHLAAALAEHAGDLTQAIELGQRAVELRPDYVPALLRLGRIHLQSNRPAEARRHFAAALAAEPASAAAHFGLGRVTALEGDHAGAVDHFEAALRLDPRADSVHQALAAAYRKLGREDEARSHLARAGNVPVSVPDPVATEVGSGGESATALIFQGNTAFAEGRHDAAEALYRRAVELAPERPEARMSLGAALFRRGDLKAAVEQYREAVRLRPDDPDARFKLAQLLEGVGDADAAHELYGAVLTDDPGHHDARMELARGLVRRGRPAEALAEYRAVLASDPNHRRANVELALALAAAGRVPDALQHLGQLLEADRDAAAVRLTLGVVLARDGRPAEALAEFDAAAAAPHADSATRAEAHFHAAAIHAARGAVQEAVRRYGAALDADAGWQPARINLANLLVRTAEPRAALEHYRIALRNDPRQIDARLGVALALTLLRRIDDASSTLEEGLALGLVDPRLDNARARLLASAPDAALRDGPRALTLARRAFEASGSPQHAETVAMAYAESGDFASAVDWQRRVIAAAERAGAAPELPRLREALRGYERGEPLRAPWGERD